VTVTAQIETLEREAQEHKRLARFHKRQVRTLRSEAERLKRLFGIRLIIDNNGEQEDISDDRKYAGNQSSS
jgi:N-formylglutamate amidohydrolase